MLRGLRGGENCIQFSTWFLSNSRLRLDKAKCGAGSWRFVQFNTSLRVTVIMSFDNALASSVAVNNMLGTHSQGIAGWLPLRTLFNSAVT